MFLNFLRQSKDFYTKIMFVIFLFFKRRSQIRSTLKKKAFEEAGVPIKPQQPAVSQSTVQQPQTPKQQPSIATNQGLMNKSAEVTLNMLNAPESEVDVEGLPDECQVKLEFEGATEEVAS